MIGPRIPKEILEARRKQAHSNKSAKNDSSDSDDSDADIVGPQLPGPTCDKKLRLEHTTNTIKNGERLCDNDRSEVNKTSELKRKEKPIPVRETLLSMHRLKNSNQNKVTKFDSKENLNNEIRKEVLRKLDHNGGLEGKFTRGS